jgi:hypothetical protein
MENRGPNPLLSVDPLESAAHNPPPLPISSGPSTAGKDLKRSGFGTGLTEMNVVLWADPCFVQAKIFRPVGPPSRAGIDARSSTSAARAGRPRKLVPRRLSNETSTLSTGGRLTTLRKISWAKRGHGGWPELRL